MKFRAKLSNESLLVLYGIINQLQKGNIGNKAVFYLNSEYIRIGVINDVMIDAIRCYSEINAILFDEYRIESLSNNTILFEIGIENLCLSLSSGKQSNNCQLKLTKRDGKPYLSFETKSLDVLLMNVIHDIPIRLLRTDDVNHYLPPEVPPPDVALELPKYKAIRSMIDKLSKFSKYINLTAYQYGRLVIQVEHSSVVIKTHFNGLIPRYENNLSIENDNRNEATVKIDVKKFSSILNFTNLIMSNAFIFLTDNSSLILHIIVADNDVGSITYYVPVIFNDNIET